jgi:hypothetical protein
MSDKKTTLVLFAYDDGSSEYAVGAHAQEVKDWINAGQSMLFAHGSTYTGRKMVFVPADDKKGTT